MTGLIERHQVKEKCGMEEELKTSEHQCKLDGWHENIFNSTTEDEREKTAKKMKRVLKLLTKERN